VQIADFVQESTDSVEEVKKSDFEPEGWRHVKHLEIVSDSFDSNNITLKFTANCFENLKALEQIEMHITHVFQLDSDAFTGLDNVTTLDMSNCGQLTLDELLDALENKLPNLAQLCISKISYRLGGINLGGWDREHEFNHTILPLATKKLKVFEVYGTQIGLMRTIIFGYLKNLEVLNLSYCNIGAMFGDRPNLEDFARIKTLDLSFVVLPRLVMPFPLGKLELTNRHFDVNFENEVLLFFCPTNC
jgi:hypothetical protein